jgi:hypothetical protein
MADAATIASLATAGGTLVLAFATFASTRSSNRSARIAERALDLNLRPVLIPAHEWDKAERVTFGDREIVQLRGGFASVEVRGENLYFAAQLRNVGGGLGVLTAWWMIADPEPSLDPIPDLSLFNAQQRHLYVGTRRRRLLAGRDREPTPTAAIAVRCAPRSAPGSVSGCSCATRTRTAGTTRSPGSRSCPTTTANGSSASARHWALDSCSSAARPQPAQPRVRNCALRSLEGAHGRQSGRSGRRPRSAK